MIYDLNIELNKLFDLLDDLECINELEKIKNSNDELIKLVNRYRNLPTIENKKELFRNNDYLNYLKNVSELNYLILEINNRFKKKRGNCEGN